MLIYRIERANGIGVYQNSGPGVDAADQHGFHPTPCNDPGLKEWFKDFRKYRDGYLLSDYFFGFESMEQLTRWFPENRWHVFHSWNEECENGFFDRRKDEKIRIVSIEVPASYVEIGYRQVMFVSAEAFDLNVVETFDSVMAEA